MASRRARGPALLGLGCAVALWAGALPAAADNGPHVKGAGIVADTCAGCHRVHTAQAPGLLKQPQTALCYTCHGASASGASTDVESGVGYADAKRTGTPGALRGGGFEYALIDSGSPEGPSAGGKVPALASGEAVTSTHSVDSSEQTAWGYGPVSAEADYGKTISLRCGNCHDPHGNGNYRVLRTTPKDLVEYPENGPEVAIADAAEKVYTTGNYWQVEDAKAPDFIADISAWCATCHTRYLAPSGSGSSGSGDAVFKYRHRSDGTSQASASCVQCHVSHGSNASMGTYSSGVTDPEGASTASDSRLLRIDNRGVCQMCHEK